MLPTPDWMGSRRGRQAPLRHLVREELEQVLGDALASPRPAAREGGVVRSGACGPDDRDDLLGRADVGAARRSGRPDAVICSGRRFGGSAVP